MNVHIIGGPGSGKTTLARDLAITFQMTHYDLDLLSRNHTEQADAITETVALAQRDGWVTEGIYLLVTDALLYHADHIVFIDVPWPVAAWRIVRRHVVQTFRGTNLYPGFKALFALLAYARHFYRDTSSDTRDTVRAYIASHSTTIEPTVEATLRDLDSYGAIVIPPTVASVRDYLARYGDTVYVLRTKKDKKALFTLLRQGAA